MAVAVLLTLVSVSFVFVSPRPVHFSPGPQSIVVSSQAAIEDPALSPDGTHVVFSDNASGSFEIWQSTLQGTQLTRLTYTQGDSRLPAYSPDGSLISFYHTDGASKEFVVVNSFGADPRVLSEGGAADGFSAWNPSGSTVAFDETANGTSQVVVVNTKSWGVVFRADGQSPAWSPDGRLLAFARQEGQTTALYLTDLGANTTRVGSSEGIVLYPRFYSNSSAIVYLSCVNDTWAIQSLRLRDGTVSNLLRAPVGGMLLQTLSPGVYSGSVPVVKPDGSSVIFSGRANQSLMDLYQVIPNTVVKVPAGALTVKYPGTIVNRLTSVSHEYVGTPSWSADGKSIVFPVRDSTGRYELILTMYSPPKPQSRYGS